MNVVENDYHSVLACPLYRYIRVAYLTHTYSHWPTQNKFKIIMSASSRFVNQKLAKYMCFATKLRTSHKSTYMCSLPVSVNCMYGMYVSVYVYVCVTVPAIPTRGSATYTYLSNAE
jgi:hypothetical protein